MASRHNGSVVYRWQVVNIYIRGWRSRLVMAGSVQTESSVPMESGIPMVSSEYIY